MLIATLGPCPRCLSGRLMRDQLGDTACLQCGYQVQPPPLPLVGNRGRAAPEGPPRRCTCCGEAKEASEFYSGGGECRACKRERSRKQREKGRVSA